ncbi:SAICAR synthetase [Roseospira marina]|uniref:SAICAR synthetase n=2 Tax=Roseospira marina TaxID=140057 RepID=A0A5M6I989_9PROT|nr:SAICAR synthetase [Roseospira marina]
MSVATDPPLDVATIVAAAPLIRGKSKEIWRLGDHRCLVRLIPSLSSFTYDRHDLFAGTEVLRLDFFEMAARRLQQAGVPVAFEDRVGPDLYIADYCPGPPFEVIVKNVATGSTTRKYPDLFREGHRFAHPVVKFDYRVDPEDQPIAEDYVREAGCDAAAMKALALETNRVLRAWLAPRDLHDFCLIFGTDRHGRLGVVSEISPDAMRLKGPDGGSLDKDLFRRGGSREDILTVWTRLVRELRAA